MSDMKWIGCAPRNFRAGRPAGRTIEGVVIHIIAGSQAAADSTFLDNTLSEPRSAHYSVSRNGDIHQYVHEEDTAYHAGVVVQPTWPLMEQRKTATGAYINPNYYTVGIEHEGSADDDWTDAMYAASGSLLRALSQKYEPLKVLSRANVVMHREIRANKLCPGTKVDMQRLIAEAMRPPANEISPGLVVTTSSVNLRIGAPSRSSDFSRTVPEGSLVHVLRAVEGEAVPDRNNHAISRWYQTSEGEFIWSGATTPVEQGDLGTLESV